jgi:PAS domain S-box-containing protein
MVMIRASGQIEMVNAQAEHVFGYSRSELLAQPMEMPVPERFCGHHPALRGAFSNDPLSRPMGAGRDLFGLRKDGAAFPVEIRLNPIETEVGAMVLSATVDISTRLKNERERESEQQRCELERSNAQYRGLLEAAPDVMVVVNQDGEIVLLNIRAGEQFGYSRDELLGQKVETIIPEGFAERLIADGLRSAAEALAQQIGTGIELSGRRKNGCDFPIETMLSPLDSSEGILVTAAIRDITTRKRAEARPRELRRSNEELEQFAYIASHDLQEPQRMVTSYTQLLSRRYKGRLDAYVDEFITFAVGGASRMQRLIRDLLAYSRVGTKGITLLDISSEHALQQALVNLQDAIEQRGAQVTHEPIPVVLADETQLIQLFQNLVGNAAVNYRTSEAPRVHVSAVRAGGGRWMFSVRDNGIGIDSQYFDKIFGMFQRLQRRDEVGGTGIGLAICKKIVERDGGNISVESKPGQGPTFRFALAGSEGESVIGVTR